MKQSIKKYFKIFLAIIIFTIPLYIAPIVNADSGWDTSYDSGGSWDSGGSYGGRGSWDSGGSYGGGGSGILDDVFLLYFTVFIILVLVICPKKIVKEEENLNKYIRYQYLDITPEHLEKYLPQESIAFIKQEMYLHFIEIQNAWMNFEYERLRSLCTDELYNSYLSQLYTLKLKHGQNIMHNFEYLDAKITNIEEINNEIVLTVFMCIEFYDYVINTKTNKIIRGNNSKKVLNNYIMTFVKEKETKRKNKKCPNCGAPNKNVTSGECEYCHSTLVTKASRFVLSSKKNIND